MKKVKLGEVVRLQGGYAFKSENFVVEKTPVIRIGNIVENEIVLDYKTTINDVNFIVTHPEFVVKKDDILIAMSGATVGKIGIYDNDNDSLLNQRVGKFVIKQNILNKYLYYVLQSNLFKNFITNNAFGCAQPNISGSQIESFEFNIYDIEFQKEIIKKLDIIQEIIKTKKKQSENLEQLIKSQFVEMFEKDNNFENILVSQAIEKHYIEKPLDGNHGSKHPKSSDYVESGVPFIMANNLKNGCIDLVNCNFITKQQADSLDKGFAKDGDVLITHKGTIGETAILHTNYEYVMLTPQITYYRTNKKFILPEYLKAYFDSELFQSNMKKIASAGSTRAYIGITEQRKLNLIVPPIELQNQFAEFVKLIDKQKFVIVEIIMFYDIILRNILK